MNDKPQPLTDRERELIAMLGKMASDFDGGRAWRDRLKEEARVLITRIERETSEAAQAQAEAWQEWGKQ